GNDVLVAGRGRDLLIGGTGSDVLIGTGNDVLVAGTTSFDADQQALASILSEWDSRRGYAERIQNLTGLFNRTWAKRLNGNFFLTPATIQDDGVADVVYGG